MKLKKVVRYLMALLLVLLSGPLLALVSGEVDLDRHWGSASRASSGMAPDPAEIKAAVVQVYAARAYGWRGLFGVHTWIATKAENATHYRVHQVMGWHLHHGGGAVDSGRDQPDRYWYGNQPQLLAELRGMEAASAIKEIEAAVLVYPYDDRYTLWPGPNSNTFTAYVARRVPALRVDLPATAVGKDYLAHGALVAPAPSGTGYQVSLLGLLGVTLAWEEGLELNLLGLGLGVDVTSPALRLPGLGRLGMAQHPAAG